MAIVLALILKLFFPSQAVFGALFSILGYMLACRLFWLRGGGVRGAARVAGARVALQRITDCRIPGRPARRDRGRGASYTNRRRFSKRTVCLILVALTALIRRRLS
jgi:hypothetical protein